MRATGFSLWLVPEGQVRARLALLIESLSRAFGTPAFEPHVTLLGGVERPEPDVREACATLARALPRLAIRLLSAHALDEYFRCVFVRVEETRELRAAHAAAREAFGAGGAGFAPHLSLVYGSLTAHERAKALGEAAAACGESFVARRLELVRTQGEVREWRVVAAWPLRPRRTHGGAGGRRSRPHPRRRRTTGSRPMRRRRSSRR